MKPILESIKLRRDQSISAFRYDEPNFETPWHFHPQHELTYIEESRGTKFIGDFVGPYQPGEWVMVRSNVPHCWKNIREDSSTARSIVLHWNPGIIARVPEFDTLFALFDQAAHGVIFSTTQASRHHELLIKLATMSGKELYLNMLQLLCELSLCDYTKLSGRRFIDDIPKEFTRRMTTVHSFIEKHCHRKIYLKEVAELVNMSEQSFSRFFSKMMGRSFFTFLNEFRINMASRMLIDTGRPVSSIGYACGYESLPFFYKQFKKYKGTSPSKYRKNYHF